MAKNRSKAQKIADEKFFLSEFEKLLEKDFENELAQLKKDKQRVKRSARYYTKAGNAKKAKAKLNSLVYFSNAEIELYNSYGKASEYSRNEKPIEIDETFEKFYQSFDWRERKKCIDWCFDKKRFSKYKGVQIKNAAIQILKDIDKNFSLVTYEQLIIVESEKKNINSIYIVNREDFETF